MTEQEEYAALLHVLSTTMKSFSDALMRSAFALGEALNAFVHDKDLARKIEKARRRSRYLRRYWRRGERMRKK